MFRLPLVTVLALLFAGATLATGAASASPGGLGSPASGLASYAAPRGGCTSGADWGRARQDLALAVVKLVNRYRAELRLRPLNVSRTLTSAALWKARHMAKYNYFGHWDPAPPVARSPFERVQACGYPLSAAGENIAYGYRTPEMVMQGWIASPGHRANMQAPQWAAIGVGVAVNGAGIPFWVQVFGARDDSRSATARQRPAARRPDWRLLQRGPLKVQLIRGAAFVRSLLG